MNKTLRRKWLWLVPLLLFALAFKAPKDVTIYINEERIETDQPPVIKHSRTFVPVRVIAENLGAQVFYLSNERAVSIETGDKIIYIPIGKKEMWVGTAELAGPVPLDAPAFIKNNRTMLPLRAIAEMFDMDVAWDGEAREVKITLPDRYLKSYVNDKNAVDEVMSRLRIEGTLDDSYYATDMRPELANFNGQEVPGFLVTVRRDNPVDENLTDHVRHFFINRYGTEILEYDPVTDGFKLVIGVN